MRKRRRCRSGGRFVRVLASVLMIVSFGSLAVSPVGASAPTTQGAVTHAGTLVGRTDATKQITLAVPLKVQNETESETFLHDLYDPSSPQFHHYLTPAEFTKRFIDASARKDVVNFLRGQGLTVTDRGLGSIVNATGNTAQLERAFNLTLSDYKDATGRVYFENDRTPAIPAAIATRIHGIIGLDNAIVDRPHFVRPPISPQPTTQSDEPRTASGCAAAVNIANVYHSFTPNQLSTAYNFDFFAARGLSGQGQTIALLEEDDYRDSNVAAYQGCFGSVVPLSRIPVDGGATLGQSGGGEVEVELDIDVVVGMAPLLSQLLVYESPTMTANVTDQYQQIANDNLAQVVSTSWGSCEQNRSSTTLNARYTIFAQMAAQGQSMFAAAGDGGSEDCVSGPSVNAFAVDDPASQPYVAGVGGTRLVPYMDHYDREIVWNGYPSNGAGGGGISIVWPKPSYQIGPGTTNSFSTGNRQVPDVAADADPTTGYTTFVHDTRNCATATGTPGATDCFEPIGGTSAGVPLWAVATALINQYLVGLGLPRIGFANPQFYLFLAHPLLASGPFHDITFGDNCQRAYNNGTGFCGAPASGYGIYPATTAYDQASGIGSMDVGQIAIALTPPTITSLSVTMGDVQGGTYLYINGGNFDYHEIVTFGGVAASSVEVVSPTQLFVTTPPHIASVVSVQVTDPTTGRSTTLGSAFTYFATTISSISPDYGGTVNSTPVTITGTHFQASTGFHAGATVTVGGVPATDVVVVSTTQITCTFLAHPAGPVSVVVTNPDGSSGTLTGGFRYIERPGPVIPGANPAPAPPPRSGGATGPPPGAAPLPRT